MRIIFVIKQKSRGKGLVGTAPGTLHPKPQVQVSGLGLDER